MPSRPLTKEGLLQQVDALRDLARRSRRLFETMELESDRRRLMALIDGIEESAARIEKQAVEAKTFVISPTSEKKSEWLA
jgi:hypothetical protein